MFESVGVILEAGTDKQGDYFSEELLQNTANGLNGDLALSFGKPNHDQFCMPYGKLLNAWLETREERLAVMARFTYHETARIEVHRSSGIELAILDFPENPKPFGKTAESESQEHTIVSIDPANFDGGENFNRFATDITTIDSSIVCDDGIVRKSIDPEPYLEILLSIQDAFVIKVAAGWVTLRIAKFATHTVDETLKQVGNELAAVLSSKVSSIFSKYRDHKSEDKGSTVTKILVPGDIEVILLDRTQSKEDFREIDFKEVNTVLEEIGDLLQDAVSVTISREDNKCWEFLYLTTNTGKVIGTSDCFDRTIRLHNEVLRNHRALSGDNGTSFEADQNRSFGISAQGHGKREISR